MAFKPNQVFFRFYLRARGKCECCGKKLTYENRDKGLQGAWHAHHIVPKSVKIDDGYENMAILCINEPENCHLNQGHGGNYQDAQPRSKWTCNQ